MKADVITLTCCWFHKLLIRHTLYMTIHSPLSITGKLHRLVMITLLSNFLKDRNHTFVSGGNDVLFVRQPNFPEFPPFLSLSLRCVCVFFFSNGQRPYMPVHSSDMLGHCPIIITCMIIFVVALPSYMFMGKCNKSDLNCFRNNLLYLENWIRCAWK